MTRSRDTANTQDNLGGAVAPYVGAKNFALNSAMEIWQRGTSFSSSQGSPWYTADRWECTRFAAIAGGTISRQTSTPPTGFQSYMRMQRDSGNTATQGFSLGQNLETINTIPLAGQVVTLSAYVRVGANYSAGTFNLTLSTGTGTDQNNFTGSFTGNASTSQNFTPTTSWARYSFTTTVPSTATQAMINPQTNAFSGTAGANDYLDITGIQLELGAQATPFSRAGGSIGGELALCQRYYYRIGGTTQYNVIGVGQGKTSTVAGLVVPFPVQMRTAVTTLDYSLMGVFDGANIFNASSVSINGGQTSNIGTYIEVTSSGLTQYRPYVGIFQNNTAAYIGFSAEL